MYAPAWIGQIWGDEGSCGFIQPHPHLNKMCLCVGGWVVVQGLQTTMYRAEARQLIAQSVNCGKDDVVLFAGSGSTGALALLLRVLNLPQRAARGEKIVVLVGPHEHHSNLLPWREAPVELITVAEDRWVVLGCFVIVVPACNACVFFTLLFGVGHRDDNVHVVRVCVWLCVCVCVCVCVCFCSMIFFYFVTVIVDFSVMGV